MGFGGQKAYFPAWIFGLMCIALGATTVLSIKYLYLSETVDFANTQLLDKNIFNRKKLFTTSDSLILDIEQIRMNHSRIENSIILLNQRFDDLFVLGGIIIGLIVTLLGAAYFKASLEIKSYFEENFDSYEAELNKKLLLTNEILGKVEKNHKLSSNILNQQKKLSNVPQQSSPEPNA